MCVLTSCSEQITSSVHLPSHFPILEGSGRGLEPRRLRGKDESPFRSRLAKRLGSHHSLPKRPDRGLPDTLPDRDCRLQPGTHLDCWGLLSVNSRAAEGERRGEEGGVHFSPARCGPTNTDGRIASATPSREGTHKDTKGDRKLSQRASG